MNKTAIEYVDQTWNPVTGCLHNCPYCYAREIAHRFGKKENESVFDCSKTHDRRNHIVKGPFPYGFDPTFHRYRLNEPQRIRKPQNIFVCSMADLFGEWVPDEWIEKVFDACIGAPQHRYLFLTKNPDRYYQFGEGDDAIIPSGGAAGYFGASACTEEQAQEAWENLNCTWMSLEPLHGDFSEEFFIHDNRYTQNVEPRWLWIVIGAETGNRKGKVIPKREWIENIVNQCRRTGTSVFLKDSLAEIWGEPLIQEYPWKETQ